jgi:hypothetical protein
LKYLPVEVAVEAIEMVEPTPGSSKCDGGENIFPGTHSTTLELLPRFNLMESEND